MYGTRVAAEAGNRFAVRLYEGVKRPGENVAVGPLCVSNALTLTAAGARGETREEMVRALGWDGAGVDVGGAWERLLGELREPMEKIDLRLGTGVWVREGIAIRREFAEVARRRFGAEVAAADFGRPAEAAAGINAWVARKTAGKIRELVGPRAVAASDAIIGSTTYFKGAWIVPFDDEKTVDGTFRVAAGREVPVRMMRRLERFPDYAETDSCQVIKLSYGHGDVQMVVALPRREDGLEALEREVSSRGVGAFDRTMDERVEVDLSLPRFSARGSYELGDALRGMGMTRAFGVGADYSGTIDMGGPFGTVQVAHEVVVDVDERGTEAAAAAMLVLAGGVVKPARRVEFKVDRPFMFAIVHRRTGAILFMGRVMDPTGG